MAIKQRTALDYVEAAADGKKAGAVDVGNQKQITIALPAELLEQVEAAAKADERSRAAWVRLAITAYLNK